MLNIDEVCHFSEHEIFMYCILLCQTEMAKFFLKQGQNEICAALVGSKIFKTYASIFEEDREYLFDLSKFVNWIFNNVFSHSFYKLSRSYESLAVDVLHLCFESNPEDAQLLLLRKIPEYDNLTPLNIAIVGNNKHFISDTCCQSLLVKIWYGHVSPDSSKLKVNFWLYCLIIFFIKYIYNRYFCQWFCQYYRL